MTSFAIGCFFLFTMSPMLWWLGRRTWAQMGGHTPTPYDRSQRTNRIRSAEWYAARGHVRRVRYGRRTMAPREENT